MCYHQLPEFPQLEQHAYLKTSPADPRYNCIAWAIGDTSRWWWPEPYDPRCYWPPGIPKEETLLSFVEALRAIGFEPCDEGEFEVGVTKIALYSDDADVPTHAARLVGDKWTSKLGEGHDIEHSDLRDLEDGVYGRVRQFFRRAG